MSDRRNSAGVSNKMVAYIAAGLVHLAIIGALLFNYTVKRDTVEAFDAEKIDTVNASVIDDRKLQEDVKEIKEKDRKKAEKEKQDRERLEKLKRDSEQEEKRIEDLKKKQKDEQEKTEVLEKEREAIALKKKKDLEAEEKRKDDLAKKRKSEEAEKKKRDQAAKTERDKKAADKRKKDAADAERKSQEDADKQRLSDMLEAEEEAKKQQQADRRAGERTATVMSKYSALIEAAIKEKWRISPGIESWREAKINIKLSPRGEVLSVGVVTSSGLVNFDRSAETAVLQASPLPFPSEDEDPEAHQQLQDINLNLKQ